MHRAVADDHTHPGVPDRVEHYLDEWPTASGEGRLRGATQPGTAPTGQDDGRVVESQRKC